MKNRISLDILDQISRHCPKAFSAYLACLDNADETGFSIFCKHDVKKKTPESYCKFKNNLKLLSDEKLIDWCEIENMIQVNVKEF